MTQVLPASSSHRRTISNAFLTPMCGMMARPICTKTGAFASWAPRSIAWAVSSLWWLIAPTAYPLARASYTTPRASTFLVLMLPLPFVWSVASALFVRILGLVYRLQARRLDRRPPTPVQLPALLLWHPGLEDALWGPTPGHFVRARPHARREAGEVSHPQARPLELVGAFDGDVRDVRLELAQFVVAGRAAVHPERRDLLAAPDQCLDVVVRLVRHRFQGRPDDVPRLRLKRDPDDGGLCLPVPVGGAEPLEGRHEVDAARIVELARHGLGL